MNKLFNTFSIAGIVAVASIAGCGSETESKPATTQVEHADDDGHDHDAGDDHGHGADDDHDDHDDHDGEAHDDHGHGATDSLGTVEIAGTTLSASVFGDVKPGAVLHIDIKHVSGPMPAAVRLWIGDESGEGSLKSKAGGSGGEYHGDAEVPASVTPATALWLEIESASGERSIGSISL